MNKEVRKLVNIWRSYKTYKMCQFFAILYITWFFAWCCLNCGQSTTEARIGSAGIHKNSILVSRICCKLNLFLKLYMLTISTTYWSRRFQRHVECLQESIFPRTGAHRVADSHRSWRSFTIWRREKSETSSRSFSSARTAMRAIGRGISAKCLGWLFHSLPET